MIKKYAVLRPHLASVVHSAPTTVKSMTFNLLLEPMFNRGKTLRKFKDELPGFTKDKETGWPALDDALHRRPHATHFVLQWGVDPGDKHSSWVALLHNRLPLASAKGLVNIGVQIVFK